MKQFWHRMKGANTGFKLTQILSEQMELVQLYNNGFKLVYANTNINIRTFFLQRFMDIHDAAVIQKEQTLKENKENNQKKQKNNLLMWLLCAVVNFCVCFCLLFFFLRFVCALFVNFFVYPCASVMLIVYE